MERCIREVRRVGAVHCAEVDRIVRHAAAGTARGLTAVDVAADGAARDRDGIRCHIVADTARNLGIHRATRNRDIVLRRDACTVRDRTVGMRYRAGRDRDAVLLDEPLSLGLRAAQRIRRTARTAERNGIVLQRTCALARRAFDGYCSTARKDDLVAADLGTVPCIVNIAARDVIRGFTTREIDRIVLD